jgi:hypothetical protein
MYLHLYIIIITILLINIYERKGMHTYLFGSVPLQSYPSDFLLD